MLAFVVVLGAVEAGLIFMDELNRVAQSLNILRGTLSRWLLPFDNNTAISDQSSTVNSVVDSMPDSIRGKLTEKQVHYLVSGLNSVRQLIRVKIADDNDLEQVSEPCSAPLYACITAVCIGVIVLADLMACCNLSRDLSFAGESGAAHRRGLLTPPAEGGRDSRKRHYGLHIAAGSLILVAHWWQAVK